MFLDFKIKQYFKFFIKFSIKNIKKLKRIYNKKKVSEKYKSFFKFVNLIIYL